MREHIRNSEIDEAIKKHASTIASLAQALKDQIANDYPIFLKTLAESKLLPSIYAVIAHHVGSTTEDKNIVMIDGKAAIDKKPAVQAKRDRAIDKAVKCNGGHKGWADAIKAAVNKAVPIPNL